MEDGEVLECADVEENKVEENKVEENKVEDKPRKKNEQDWKKYQNMSVEEKRKYYKCGDDYVQIKDIETWPEFFQENEDMFSKIQKRTKMEKPDFPFDETINNKISLWEGDITRLEIDAIVNAANSSLLGGGGVDGCIHRAAGKTLVEECRLLNRCDTGDAKITSGHKLPAKHVIHTVGPMGENEKALKSCYNKCLKVASKNEVRTLAFCCISTGIYGYPNRDAAEVALRTTREWLDKKDNAGAVDRIIFCLFLEKDIDIYHALMLKYFPPEERNEKPTQKSDKTTIPAAKSEEDEETRKKEPKKGDANHKDEDSRSESDENLEAEAGKGNKEMETEVYKEKDEKKVASTLEDAVETAERKEKLGSDEEMKRVEELQKGSEGILEDGGDNNPSKAEENQTGEENVSKEKKKEEETQMGRKVKENDNSIVENPTSKKQKQDNANEANKSQDAEMTEVKSPAVKEQKTAEEKEQDLNMDMGKETSL